LPWLQALRQGAIASFAELGMPTTRQEDWRFTRLTPLTETAFETVDPVASLDVFEESPEMPARVIGDAHRLVFVNGVFSASLSTVGELSRGVRVSSLADVLTNEPERLQPHLAQLADPKTRAFSALNTALACDGVVVELEADVVVKRPIHAVFIQHAEAEPLALHPRNLVIVGPGSRSKLVEHYVGANPGPSLTNAVTEVVVGRDAELEHIKLQEEAEEAYHIAGMFVRQEAGSRFVSHSVSSGARIMRFDIQTSLVGEQAHCTLNGLYLARNRQHADHHTTIDHAVPQTTSQELYAGILGDRAKGVFHGRIRVRPDAQKISANQNNRNLLLSDDATVNTKPQLEIYADDVRCTHGAAIGRLDEDALFYLRSRGIGLEAARALLTFAFASKVIKELPFEHLREYLEVFLLHWLPRKKELA
jgi:Fe-S cluster assembly protein SufD